MKILWLAMWIAVSISTTSVYCLADLITVTDAGNRFEAQGFSFFGTPHYANESSGGNTLLLGSGAFSDPFPGPSTSFYYSVENAYSTTNTSAALAINFGLNTNVYNSQQEYLNGSESLSSRITFTLHEQAIAELGIASGMSGQSPDGGGDSNTLSVGFYNFDTGEGFFSTNMLSAGMLQSASSNPPPHLVLDPGTYILASFADFIRSGQFNSMYVGGSGQVTLSLTSTAVAVPEPSIAIWSGLAFCGWYGRRRWKQRAVKFNI